MFFSPKLKIAKIKRGCGKVIVLDFRISFSLYWLMIYGELIISELF